MQRNLDSVLLARLADLEVHHTIAEMMILANVEVAKFIASAFPSTVRGADAVNWRAFLYACCCPVVLRRRCCDAMFHPQ